MRYQFQNRGQRYEINIERQGKTYTATISGQPFEFTILDSQTGRLSLLFEGRPLTIYWAADGDQKWFSLNGCTYCLERPAPRRSRPQQDQGEGESVRAPMPAQVRAVLLSAGDDVEKGQTILLLEAMKMEIRIKAPVRGKMVRLPVSAGQAVEKDQVLAEIGEREHAG